MDILVIGGGGREHAIIWKLKQSKNCGKVYCIPGNAGISELAECRYDIKVSDTCKILNFLNEHKNIGLTVVAPDDPLANGLVDRLEENGHRAFGPKAEAAIIEGSKAFSKRLMKKYNIPTAEYEVFTDYCKAAEYIKTQKYPLVIKADGLALGKGVIICENLEQAEQALKDIMVTSVFGKAGSAVVVEEFLTGREVSVLCFTDGKTVVPMVSSQDHKRALDGDKGLNTGGMGTFSPSKIYSQEMAEYAEKNIFYPTIRAMEKEGRLFKGVLYFGLMVTKDGIKVLEYNARFGDPETQVILPRLKTDLIDIFNACIDGSLDKLNIEWDDSECVCVILASKGYPQSYPKGIKIDIGNIDSGIMLFHAGTAFDGGGNLITAGGRVIGVTAKGKSIEEARAKAYKNAEKVNFEGKHYRRDIGINI